MSHERSSWMARGRGLALFTVLALAGGALVGCGGGGGGGQRASRLTIKGSDTMVILGQRWAETYMQGHTGTTVQVTGGGTGTGIAALINGTTEIAQASRPMKDPEKAQIQEKTGAPVQEVAVAKDGLTVYVHESNPATELSIDQLKAAFTGQVKNWKELGGPDRPITLYSRENSSGTYEFFKEHVLGGDDFAPEAQTLPGTAAVVNAVQKDPNGIGYGGIAYMSGVKALAVSSGTGPAVTPDEESIRSGAYPLARDLYWYTTSKAPPTASEMITWVLSPEGQAVVKEVGYLPVR